MKDFLLFIRKQGVVGLAVGFILGGSVGKVVTSLVADIIQPIIGLIFGSVEGLKSWQLSSVMIGNFLVSVIDFLIVAAVIYFVFKKLNLEKIDTKETT